MPILTRALSATLLFVVGVSLTAQSGAPKLRSLRANGTDLTYVEEGRGTPVVFVHGAACDLRYWEPQRRAFARQHRYIAYNHRYHGTEPWPDEGTRYSAATHAEDLIALIESLNAGPVHLVGLSYGGLLAAIAALEQPKLVRTLTLAEPGMFSLLADSAEGKQALNEWEKGMVPMIEAIQAGDLPRATRHLTTAVTGASAEEFESMPEGFRRILLDNARTLPLLLTAAPPDLGCDALRGIKMPTLVVRGERTPRVFSAITDAVGRCIGGSRVVVIPNASHAMSYDNPEAFNRTVLEFIGPASADPPLLSAPAEQAGGRP